jgi:ferredoxin
MHDVLLKTKNQVFTVEDNEVLYDSLESQGEDLPHGCLSGSCGACRVEILSGSENLKPASTIEKNTIDDLKKDNPHLVDKNIRLSCRARVFGNIEFQPVK